MVSELGGTRLVVPREVNAFYQFVRRAYEILVAGANYLQAPLLFALRVYFFWQLFLAGKGKLLNIEKTAEFFGSLNIPLPLFSAYLASATECFGGLLLMVGLCSRLRRSLLQCSSPTSPPTLKLFEHSYDPTNLSRHIPFTPGVLLILAFGPGAISIDALIKRFAARQRPNTVRF
jgi:putative oxidoreductase